MRLREIEGLNMEVEERNFYADIKKIKKQFQPRTVGCKNEAGAIIMDEREILSRWAKNFIELMNEQWAPNFVTRKNAWMTKTKSPRPLESINTVKIPQRSPDLNISELFPCQARTGGNVIFTTTKPYDPGPRTTCFGRFEELSWCNWTTSPITINSSNLK